MNRWTETFKAHPVHKSLSELSPLVNVDFNDLDEHEISERRRFLKAIEKLDAVLKNIDPELTPITQLDSLNTALINTTFKTHLNNYSNDGEISHLISANDFLTNNLTSFFTLLPLSEKIGVEKEVGSLEASIDHVSNALTKKKNKIITSLEELSAFSEDTKKKLQELEIAIEKNKHATNEQMTLWQKQFSEAQERRNTDFDVWKKDIDQTHDDVVEEMVVRTNNTFNQQSELLQGKIDHILNDATSKHLSIQELYGLVSEDSVAGGYKKNADNELKQANKWRWISIIFISFTIGWLIFSYLYPPIKSVKEDMEIIWPQLLMALSLTGVLLFGAAYSAQQSNCHRQSEKKMRWFALQVKAIDPFISSLEIETQHELKKALTERLFAQEEAKAKETHVIDEHILSVFLKGIADAIKAAK